MIGRVNDEQADQQGSHPYTTPHWLSGPGYHGTGHGNEPAAIGT